ncbi:MAG: hypothetical protein EGP68_11085 [Lachnospiraceae bacterium]|nr:hypothetical protein [Lachnospiraceae bacterium]
MPVSYFAYGLYESYIDKHRASHMNVFGTTVGELHQNYLRPQENGSHYNCHFIQTGSFAVRGNLALRNIRSGRLRKRDIIMRWRKLGKLWSAPITR